ncbi:YdcH family protein [uncultured Cocleimonas sp.]|uniref:YdcH family protein n=1 Tax=uncultured Cocleimonas sp. TaxID=1051587 RepID=UPI002627F569|nr:YdcH family protein [uncultured Cocleimonas sp.]
MFGENHDLHHEFPEFKDKIHDLKMNNGHFQRLFKEYDEIVHQITRVEQEIETPSDDVVEEMKKQRLYLKDQLFEMLKA